MSDSRVATPLSNYVADNWDETDDKVSMRFVQHEKAFLKNQEGLQNEHNLDAPESGIEEDARFKVLKRPSSRAFMVPSMTLNMDNRETDQQSQKSYEERQAAYLEARVRIFGDEYIPSNSSSDASALSKKQVPRSFPVPRPRLSDVMGPLLTSYRPHILGIVDPNFMAPPTFGPYPFLLRHQIPMQAGLNVPPVGMHSNCNGIESPHIVYDSRIPPPSGPAPMLPMGNFVGPAIQNSRRFANPVPYGRPPAHIISHYQPPPGFEPPQCTDTDDYISKL